MSLAGVLHWAGAGSTHVTKRLHCMYDSKLALGKSCRTLLGPSNLRLYTTGLKMLSLQVTRSVKCHPTQRQHLPAHSYQPLGSTIIFIYSLIYSDMQQYCLMNPRGCAKGMVSLCRDNFMGEIGNKKISQRMDSWLATSVNARKEINRKL